MTTKPRQALGFDFGRRRIGVAVAQELSATTRPLTSLQAVNNKPNWDAIERLIKEWQPDILVVGLPMNMDGTEHDMSRAARRFSNQLNGRFNIPVELIDERLTSVEAEEIMVEARREGRIKRSKSKTSIDQIAAELILKNWLEIHSH